MASTPDTPAALSWGKPVAAAKTNNAPDNTIGLLDRMRFNLLHPVSPVAGIDRVALR
jgi:hypothetical protein